MEYFEATKKFLHYLVTDSIAVGSTGLVGVIFAVIGFWITIVQARQAKKAAIAAKEAAENISKMVFARERLLEINLAIAHVEDAIERLSQSRFQEALIFIDFTLAKCAQIRELLDGDGKKRFYRNTLRLRRLAEAITSALADRSENDVSIQLILEARSIVSFLNEYGAKLRYAYDEEEAIDT